jgi:cardiolipin synthase
MNEYYMITLATLFTLIRLFSAPIVSYFIVQQAWLIAATVFMLAAATDLIDGYIARRYNQQTRLGQLLDPIADKCLIMSTLFSLLFVLKLTSCWHVIAVYGLMLKEVILLVGGAILWFKYQFFIIPSRLSRACSLAEIILITYIFGSQLLVGNVMPAVISIILLINIVVSVWLLSWYVVIIINRK